LPPRVLKKDFNPVCRPHGDASSEEILILAPNAAIESYCDRQYRPVILIATAQTFSGFILKFAIQLTIDR